MYLFYESNSKYFTKFKTTGKSIRNYFIKYLFDGYECNGMERELFRLLAKSGGLGTKRTSKISDRKYRNSRILTQEGSQLIKNQYLIYDLNQNQLEEIRKGIKYEKSKQYQDTLTKIKQTLENDRSRLKS